VTHKTDYVFGPPQSAEKAQIKNLSSFYLINCDDRWFVSDREAGLTEPDNSENWARLQGVIESGAWRREPMDWAVVSERANQLIDRVGARLKAGTLDTLHVAHALHSGCTRFLSFDTDSNARTLAASCKLKVYPVMTGEEKGRLLR
jgi:hypothetical protein